MKYDDFLNEIDIIFSKYVQDDKSADFYLGQLFSLYYRYVKERNEWKNKQGGVNE